MIYSFIQNNEKLFPIEKMCKGLRSKLSKRFKVTTNSKHNYLIVENILNREFVVKIP